MKRSHFLLLLMVVGLLACQSAPPTGGTATAPQVRDDMTIPGLAAVHPDSTQSLKADTDDWYKRQVFYHLWVASFNDSDGDGTGDIKGITAKLDYLKDLGVTALWLSPFFKSSSSKSNLHGYDVVDHYTVDERLGTNDDVKDLLKAAHAKGLRVIFDFVPNHVSNHHPWFEDSAGELNGKRDWFLWTNDVAAEGWANWSGDQAWHPLDQDSSGKDQYYYGLFSPGMPDLNYRNPAVRTAMAQAAQYWLDQGFDGLRADAVRFLVESPDGVENGVQQIYPATMAWFEAFRHQVLDPYSGLGYPKFMVAENWTTDSDSLKSFMQEPGHPGFQMMLDFAFGNLVYNNLKSPRILGDQSPLIRHWQEVLADWAPLGGWAGTFLNNHDNYQSRPATAFVGHPELIQLAAALQLTGVGTPFWYYGNEVEMPGQNKGDDRQFRQKMVWDNLDTLRKDPASTWNAVRELMQARASRVSLQLGGLDLVSTGSETVKAFVRTQGSERTLVVVNFGEASATVNLTLTAKTARVLAGPQASLATTATGLTVANLASYKYVVVALE